MLGKVVLITGANSGIGFVTARELASMGASVLMVCRGMQRGQRARDEIAQAATGEAPELLLADMSSQAAIRTLAQDLHRRFSKIDVLINNVEGIFASRELTTDGIAKTFATNHLAPFLLTSLIAGLLQAGGRIINVASRDHAGTLEFDNLQGERRYNFLAAYPRSRLGNILFTYELARQLDGSGISANCVSPRPTETRFGYHMTGLAGVVRRIFVPLAGLFVSPEKGASTSVYLASSPEVAEMSGRFFLRRRVRQTKPVTHDVEVAARLWSISAGLVQLPLEKQVAQHTTTSETSLRSAL